NELHRIGIDNDEEIFADFEEHFKASQEEGLTEEETCEKLGDVKEIARNYLDIESTRLNSIVANAIANEQQRVSLTKPGMEVPADISLVKEQQPEQPAIREYTPEHLMDEPETPAPVSPRINLVKEEPAREVTPEHIAQEPEAQSSPNSAEQPREFTPQHDAQEQPAPEAASSSIPKQTDERSQNNSTSRQGEVPPQSGPAAGSGKGGFRFSDIKGMTPNVNVGKLICCLCLDVFLWSWLLPMVATCIASLFVSVVIGLGSAGFAQLGNEYFHVLSRIFLCCGMVSGAAVLCGLCIGLVKAYIHWIKSIVISHVKAIYDL
ncbi:MAG: HAAS signaling domain-containing protein, partial [Oscillospiraceae bacterium]